MEILIGGVLVVGCLVTGMFAVSILIALLSGLGIILDYVYDKTGFSLSELIS